jgi:hypothetical protein
LLAALWLPHGFISAETGLLYSTDFENFPAGANQWAGTEGWFSNAGSLGIQGIDQDQVAGIGNSAFLGFNTPALRWNYVARPFNHNPVTQGSASIEIDTLLGIQDSTNGNFDSFFVSIYNHLGQFLAAIQFTNEKQLYRIWRDNGVSLIDTTINFIPGELQLLFLRIDLINNRWSAEHDGIPLFTDQTFTMSENSRTFGSLSYEWQITDEEPANHGDNWMLVAGCEAWAIPPATKEVTVNPITFSETGEPGFEFDGEPGWTYQIEYTESFAGWNNDLPDSTFVITEQGTKVQFTDPSNRQPKTRFYRVLRTVTPQSRRITS